MDGKAQSTKCCSQKKEWDLGDGTCEEERLTPTRCTGLSEPRDASAVTVMTAPPPELCIWVVTEKIKTKRKEITECWQLRSSRAVSIPTSLLFPVEQEDTAASRFSNLRRSTNPSHRRVGVPKDPPFPRREGRSPDSGEGVCTTHSQRFAPECSSRWGTALQP